MSRRTFEEYRERREKYLAKILEYEELFRRDPEAYFRRANLARISGYSAYIFIVLVVGTVLGALLYRAIVRGRASLLWLGVTGYALYQLLRALFAKVDDDQGLKIDRSDAPGLFERIDVIAAKMGNVSIDGVRITEDLNASAYTRIKSVLSRRTERYLSIGLPVLELFSAKELEGVIAHELGHFRGSHGERAIRLYHAQATLERAAYELSNSWLGGILRSTAELFEERFDVLLLAVKREQEYEADAAEAEQVGAEVYWRAGLKFLIYGRWWSRTRYGGAVELVRQGWPGYENLLDRSKQIDRPSVAKELLRSLHEKTRPIDSHPSLGDRLRRVGIETLPRSEEEAAIWIDRVLDYNSDPKVIEEWFSSNGRTRVRSHFEETAEADFKKIAGNVEEVTKDDGSKAVSPDEGIDLNVEASGARAIEYIRRLYATDRVHGRAEFTRRLKELAESPNPFHRFLAIQELWSVDQALYESTAVSLSTTVPYEDYAAYLIFNLLEHQERLDEGKSVFEFLELRRERSRDFRAVFGRGPRAMEIRAPSISRDLEDYIASYLDQYDWISGLYVVEAKPKGTKLPFEPVFIVDYLSKKERFWFSGRDYSELTTLLIREIQSPTFLLDFSGDGRKWRSFISDPRVRVLIPYRDPVREPDQPWWKRVKKSI